MRSGISNQGWKFISRPLQFAALVAAIICVAVTPRNLETVRAQSPHPGANVLAWQALKSARHISTSYQGRAETVAKLRSGAAPLAMASADFDGDGIADLVVGFAHSSGGILAVHRGNLDAFAPQSHASWLATAHGHPPAPFLPKATLIEVPEAPQFIVTGDFTGNGDISVLTGNRGSPRLYLLVGNGKGKFTDLQMINLPGALTALAAGQVGIRDGRTDVVAGVQSGQTASVLVYKGSASGLARTPVSYLVPSPATQLEIGDLHGDGIPDVTVLAGGEVLILHPTAQSGEDTSALIERVAAAGGARSIAVGGFVWDRKSRNQLAVLSPNGTVQVLSSEELDTRPFTTEEMRIRRTRALRKKLPSGLNAPWSGESHAWSVIKSSSVSAPMSGNVRLMAAGLAHTRPVDLMVVDASDRRLHVLPANTSFDSADEVGELTVDAGDAPVAVLPMRVGADTRSGLVMMGGSAASPMTITPQPNISSTCCTVNRFDDPPVALASVGNYCIGGTNDCSLRQAVIKSNSLTPNAQTINLPAGTITLTITGQGEVQALKGDLDVTNSVTFMGSVSSGVPTSIIQGCGGTSGIACTGTDGATAWNDKFISGNKMGTSNANLTISNVVFQNGNNTNLFSTNLGYDALGGAVAFYGCATIAGGCSVSGTSSLSVTNAQFLNNSIGNGVTNGAGGGCSGGGNIVCGGGLISQFANTTISQSTFTSNKATNGRGGALSLEGAIETMTVSASTFTGNTSGIEGGAVDIDFQDPGATGSVLIHSSTISNNTSGTFTAADGGGVFVNLARPAGATPVETASASIDQKTVISGNTATSNRGGGIDFIGTHESPTINTSLTLSKVTITGNHSGASTNGGGGIYVPIGGTLNVQYSRIVGNTAPSGKPTGIGIETSSTATINAGNNWWGCNTGPSASPCDTVGYSSGSSGTATITDTPYIILSLGASPTTLQPQPPGTTTSALTADFLHEASPSQSIALANIDVLLGLPISFGATHGTISGAQTTIQSGGTATANVSPNTSCLTPLVASATVDSGTPTQNITVVCPDMIAGKSNNVSGSVPLATPTWTWTIDVLNGPSGTAPALFTNGETILTDTLPGGTVSYSTPSYNPVTNLSCSVASNVLTCSASGGDVTFSQGQGFFVSVTATATAAGSYVNPTSGSCSVDPNNDVIEVNESNNACGPNTVTVVAPPTISKAFGSPTIPVGGTTTMTFTLTNPSANTVAETGVAFSDTLTGGLVVAGTPGFVGNCGGSVAGGATPGSSSLALSGGSISANSSCTITLNVTDSTAGTVTNTTTAIQSTNGGTGTTSNTAHLIVVNPPTISKGFSPTSIPVGMSSTVSFTISNPNAAIGLTGVAFTDNLPGTLVVASPVTASNTCGGTLTDTASTGTISLSGGTITASGSCSISVAVTSSTAATYNNTTGNVTATESGTAGSPSNTASLVIVAPASISKAFVPSIVPQGNDSTVSFTITNPNSGTIVSNSAVGNSAAKGGQANRPRPYVSTVGSLSNLAFTDTLPGDMVVASTPGVTNSCNGSVTATGNNISLGNGFLAQGGSCQITVNVVGPTATTYNNQTSGVSSTEGGTGLPSNSAMLTVQAPQCSAPPLNMDSWWPAESNANDIVGGNNGAVTGATFAPGEVGQAFKFNGANNDHVVTPATTNIAGGPEATYDAWVYPTAIPDVGNYGAIFGAGDGTTSSWDPQQCRLLYSNTAGSLQFYMDCGVNNADAVIKRTTANSYPPNEWYHVAAVVNNGNIDLYVNGVLDNGTGTSIAGASINTNADKYVWMGALVSSDHSLVAAGFTGLLDEVEIFSRALTGTEVNNLYLAGNKGKCKVNATISKAFSPGSIPGGTNSTLTFTVTNPNAAVNLSGVAFTDNLPSGVQVAAAPNVHNTCGGTFAPSGGDTSIGLSGGSVAANSSCSLSVDVTSSAPGDHDNTTGTISTNEAGTGATSNTARLTVVAVPPSIQKSFGAATVPLNGSTSLTFTITNPNSSSLTGVGFTDTLPSGLIVSTPNNGLTGSCDSGTITATPGSGTVSLLGATLTAGSGPLRLGAKRVVANSKSNSSGGPNAPTTSSCMFSVNVTGMMAGVQNNSVTVTSNEAGNGNTSMASVTVDAPPTIQKMFGAASIELGEATSLSFMITNPNTTNTMNGIGFSDTLPAGLVITSPSNGLTGSCGGGTITATANTNVISLSGASLAAGANCTFSVGVASFMAGEQDNTTGNVTSTEGGMGGTASASIAVVAPPTFTKAFNPAANTQPGDTSTLTITITNPAANSTALMGIGFNDPLPAGMAVTSPSNGLTNTCGGTATATPGSGSVSLSGGTISTPGASCAVTVSVTTTKGGTNTIPSVTSSNGGTQNNPATARLATCLAPPANMIGWWPGNGNTNDVVNGNNGTWSGTSAYGAGKVGQAFSFSGSSFVSATGGSGPLNLTGTAMTIDGWVNPNTTGVNGVYFGKTHSGANDYLLYSSGGAMVALVKTTSGESLVGGSFTPPAGQWSHIAMTYDGTNIRLYANGALIETDPKTGNLAGSNVPFDIGGRSESGLDFNGLIDEVEVFNRTLSDSEIADIYNAGDAGKCLPPAISKMFAASSVPVNATTSLTFTITKQAVATMADTGIAFTDTLPGGLVVATSNGLTNSCGGTALAVPGSTSISLSGGSITNPGDTCTVVANVTATQAGSVTNTTGPVSSTNGGNGAPGTATLSVATPPTIQKGFGASTIPLNTSTSLTFTITNPNASLTLTGLNFTDGFPGGLQVAAMPNASNSCGGTFAPAAGDTTVGLSGGTLGSGSCALSVTVTGTAAGMLSNTTGPVNSDQASGSVSNTAPLTVVAPPLISKGFAPSTVPYGNDSTLTFMIVNPNSSSGLSNISFTDNLPSGLKVSNSPDTTNTCNGMVTAASNTTMISLNGGMIVSGGSCAITVNVTPGSGPTYDNQTSTIGSAEGGTGAASNKARLTVITPACDAPPANMVSWWPGENNANDITGGNSGTTTNTTYAAGEAGQAFSFDGADAYFTVADSASLDVPASPGFTFDMWLNPSQFGGSNSGYRLMFGKELIPGQASYFAFLDPSGKLGMGLQNSTLLEYPEWIATQPILLNEWSHIVFAYKAQNFDASDLVIYVNGAPVTTTFAAGNYASNFALAYSTSPLRVGGDPDDLVGGYYAGLLDELEFFNRQLTATEVQNIYLAGSKGKCKSNASINKMFTPSSIPEGGTSTLSFTISNPNTEVNLSGVSFTDNLPSGIQVAGTPNVHNTCGGTFSPVTGNTSISLSGGFVAANSSCSLSVDVTSSTPGNASNTTGPISTNEAGTGAPSNTAILKVVAPPSIAKAFNPNSIAVNATTSLTFTITNPAANTTGLTGVAFSDTLPTGLTVATSSATVCGGTLTTTSPTTIALSGASIAMNSQCQFSVTVTGAASGSYTNTTGNVTSTNGGTGNTASAILKVGTPPTIRKSFTPSSVSEGGASTLSFTITNSTSAAQTGVSFSDSLPSGVQVASSPQAANTCGGTFSAAAGATTVGLTGGSVGANTSCTLSVKVTGKTAGVKNNTTGAISSTQGGTGTTSNTATLTVIAPPTIHKSFAVASIPLNGTTTLSFSVGNPNTTATLTHIQFTDNLPTGLVVSTPNGLTGSCDGGTISASAGAKVISLSGATLAPGASCTFSVKVSGTTAGTKNNVTGAVSSSECGSGGTASASLNVVKPPSLYKAFGSTSIALNSSTKLIFTVTNPSTNTVALTGVAFTDSLPSGLVISTPNELIGSCGGTVTATAGSGMVSLSGGSVNAGASCTFSVKVTAKTKGSHVNVTSSVTSSNGGTGNTATATLSVN